MPLWCGGMAAQIGFDGAKISKVFGKAVKIVLIIILKYVNNRYELT